MGRIKEVFTSSESDCRLNKRGYHPLWRLIPKNCSLECQLCERASTPPKKNLFFFSLSPFFLAGIFLLFFPFFYFFLLCFFWKHPSLPSPLITPKKVLTSEPKALFVLFRQYCLASCNPTSQPFRDEKLQLSCEKLRRKPATRLFD